jgi:hypothetical protein
MNIHLFIRRGPPQPVEQNLFVLLHDFECDDGNFQPYLPRVYGAKKGLPETEKCLNSNFESMNETWQKFWFELFKRFDNHTLPEETLRKRWANLTHGNKAFTNMHGSNTHRDYINGQNMEAEEMGQENVTTCGNVVLAAGEPVKMVGKMFLPVRCIDRQLPPPPIDQVINQPWFVHRATVCLPFPVDSTPQPNAPNGRFCVNPFPDLDGRDVPVPFITKGGTNYIDMRRLRKLNPGEVIPSPYVR